MPNPESLYSKGDQIGDRFTVLEILGAGGLGEVYKVEDEDDAIFACKVLRPKVVPPYVKIEKIRSVLIDQAPEIIGLVRPSNVLELGDKKVVLSEYVQGADLRTIFKTFAEKGSSFDPLAIARIVDQVLATLANMPPLAVHGMLKPSNIIIKGASPDGDIPGTARIFITDYGAGRMISFSKFASIQLSRGNEYYYLAPEFISQGGRVGRSADIFALGVLLYEGISGKVPKKEVLPLSELADSVEPALNDLVLRAITKQPEVRFQEFGVFREALRAALPDMPEYAPPTPADAIEKIETEDIFILDEEDAEFADGVEEVDVFEGVEPASPEEIIDMAAPEQDEALVDIQPPGEEPPVEEEIEVFEELEKPVEAGEAAPAEPDVGKPRKVPPAKEEKRPVGTVLLILFLLLIAAALAYVFIAGERPEEEIAPTPTPAVFPVSMATPVPTPVAMATPAKTPEPTPKATPSPTPTPPPTLTPDPVVEKIKGLIAKAELQKKKKHYLAPSNSNLLRTVEQIEKLDSKHPYPKTARKLMVAEFSMLAENAFAKKKWNNAKSHADDGLKVDPYNNKLKDMLAMIDKELSKPKPKPKACSEGMVYVYGGTLRMGSAPDDPMRRPGEKSNEPIGVASFCIDRYEFPNKPGNPPKVNVSWYEAKAACESQGKRLCKEAEWERACKGPENHRYPYGNEFSDATCNTADKDGSARKLNVAGAHNKCRSVFGVYDMSGNVREWTVSHIAVGNAALVVKGGSAIRPDWATRCAVRDFATPNQTSSLIGFRCCSNVKTSQ